MDKNELMKYIPHRGSMLILDEYNNIDKITAEGKYKIRGDEFFLDGHYPMKKIVPGTLLCEMMAQVVAVYAGQRGKSCDCPLLAEINNAKFKKIAEPGNELTIRMEITKDAIRLLVAACEVYVKDNVIARADITVVIP